MPIYATSAFRGTGLRPTPPDPRAVGGTASSGFPAPGGN